MFRSITANVGKSLALPSGEPVQYVRQLMNVQFWGGDMKVKHTDFGTIIEFLPEEHQLCMMILGIASDVIQDCDPESAQTLNQVVDSIEQIESLIGHA